MHEFNEVPRQKKLMALLIGMMLLYVLPLACGPSTGTKGSYLSGLEAIRSSAC